MALGLGNNSNNNYTDHGDIAGIDGSTVLGLAFWVAGGAAVSASEIRKGSIRLFEMGGDRSYQIREVGVWQLNSAADAIPPDATNWNHFLVVYDGSLDAASRITIYKNGLPLALSGSYPGTALSSTSPETFRIGDANVSGLIGHVRLWQAALTAADSAQEVHRYWACRRAHLLLDAPYDDALYARDYSGNGNHGTWNPINGTPEQRQGPPVSYGGTVLVTG